MSRPHSIGDNSRRVVRPAFQARICAQPFWNDRRASTWRWSPHCITFVMLIKYPREEAPFGGSDGDVRAAEVPLLVLAEESADKVVECRLTAVELIADRCAIEPLDPSVIHGFLRGA